jgi:PAS domain S-box-containing protein
MEIFESEENKPVDNLTESFTDILGLSSGQFLNTLLETANSLIICLDKNGRLLLFNRECEKVTGHKAEDVIGEYWPDLCMTEDFSQPGPDEFADWVRKNPRDIYERPLKTKAGEIRTILWSNSVIFSEKSDDLLAIAVGQDITERKRGEELLRSVINAATESILLVDRDNKILMINDVAAERMGETAEQLIGVSGNDYQFKNLPKDVLDARIERVRKVFETGKPLRFEDNLREGLIFDVNNLPIIDAEGNVAQVAIFARDITERKRAEDALRESERKFRELIEFDRTFYA